MFKITLLLGLAVLWLWLFQIRLNSSSPPRVILPATPSATIANVSIKPSPVSITQTVKVIKVVDGDTVILDTGQRVRYIGIDTPEIVHSHQPPECYGAQAATQNRQLVEGRLVSLEKDVSETDNYGRLLRYVWVDNQLVNEILVLQGYARAQSYPPDIKYQPRLFSAQKQAQKRHLAIWGEGCP